MARLICFLLLFLIKISSCLAQIEVSAVPYPEGDLRIVREDITTSSFRLKLENFGLREEPQSRSRSQNWLLAGTRGKTPQYEIESASFLQLRDGKETSRTTEVPESLRNSFVKVAELGLYRQWWTFSVAFSTATPIEDNVFWVLDKAVIKFDIGSPDARPDDAFVSRFNKEPGSVAEGLLLNPNIDPEYYIKDFADPVDRWKDWSGRLHRMADTGSLFRIKIYHGGVYRISVADIQKQTSATLAEISQWRVFRGGNEIKLIEDTNSKNSVFLPVQTKADDGFYEDVYWLDCSGNISGVPPLRLTSPNASLPVSNNDVTTAGFSLIHRELQDYNPRLRAVNGGDRWVWADVNANAATNIEFDMPGYYAPASDSLTQLTFAYGFTNFPPTVPALLVYINGNAVGQTTLTMQQGSVTLSIPAESLKPGHNEASLALGYPSGISQKRETSLQFLKTDWVQQLPATFNEQFEVKLDSSSTETHALLFPDSLNPATIALAYANNEPVLLDRKDNRFYCSYFSAQKLQIAQLNDSATTPVLEHVSAVSDLSEIRSARSVIIAHESLLKASEGLKKSHMDRGLSTELYGSQQLYDIFSYGDTDPDALRNALRYCFNAAPGDLPEYVTLIGEASDFQGDLSLPKVSVQANLMPSSNANSLEASQGDQRYAASIGSDQIVDLKVGRIPASVPEQVIGYIEKVNRYYNSPEITEEWNRHVGFAMDDNDEFPEVVERIIKSSMSPGADLSLLRQWDYEYVPNLRVPGKKRSWQATEELIKEFNSGYSVLNFFGHGGPNLWSHERLFHLSDLPKIRNSTRLPLVTCASCDNAWISYPTPPVQASMGEQLVLKTDGGAIALFGPVAGASPYEHAVLVQALMSGIFRTQLKSFGHLILYAKNSYFNSTRSTSIMDQYLLLGDPAAVLHYASVKPGLRVENAWNIKPGSTISVSLPRYDKDADTTGMIRVASSSEPEHLLVDMPITVSEGSWTVSIPATVGNGALQFALDIYGPNGLIDRYGAVARIDPTLSTAHILPVLIGQEGTGYRISALDGVNTSLSTGNTTLKLKISAEDKVSSSVSVYATDSLGAPVGEVARVEIPEKTREVAFDLTASTKLTGTDTSISISVVPLTASRTNPVSTTTLLYQLTPPVDLSFVPGSATAYTKGAQFTANSTVFLEADLLNKGDSTIKMVTLQALNGDPTTGTELQTINEIVTQRLNDFKPGEKRRVQFRWENPTVADYDNVFLVVNKSKTVQELSYDNNSIRVPRISVKGMQNYKVHEFTVDRTTAIPGSTVELKMVFERESPTNDHPVTLEVGWIRTMDRQTSFSRTQVEFDDMFTTSIQHLVVPEGFNQAYCKINADLEVEETYSGDNSAFSDNIVVAQLPDNTIDSWDLSNYIEWGNGYNLFLLPGPKVTIATDFTSSSGYLVFDENKVTTGSASRTIVDDDNRWGVVPWRVAVSSKESAGALGLETFLGLSHNVPGLARAYFGKKPASGAPVSFRQENRDRNWIEPVFEREENGKFIYTLSPLYIEDGKLQFELEQNQTSEVELSHMQYYPHAIEWESPPFSFVQDHSGQGMEFSVETDEPTGWETFSLDYRLGSLGDKGAVTWNEWQSSSEGYSVRFNASPIFQLRIVGAPVSGKKPSLFNFRLKPL